MPVIDIRDVRKTYGSGEGAVQALRGVTLSVEHGDYLAIMGSSGSGKSTLMHVLGCLDVPTAGRYRLEGVEVAALGDAQLALLRNRRIGFVFQSFNLLARSTALANVELPLTYAGVRPGEREERARRALAAVGLADRAGHRPNQLSGGQQQRVAIARALVTGPAVLLADEPTGALDSASTEDLLGLLDRLSLSGTTIVVVTHEESVARHAKRVVRVMDGRIEEDVRVSGVHEPPPLLARGPAS